MTPERWQQIKGICIAVLDAVPEERTALMDALCAGDDSLKHDVGLMMADAVAPSGAFLQPVGKLLGIPDATVPVARVQEARTTWRPEAIGNYRIVRPIGEGGMGIVYEAEQEQPRRTVALKVIRPDFAGQEVVRRFRQESQALGRLQHPGIAQIYEAGTADSPFGAQPYFVMELIHGEPLTKYAESRGLIVRERLELVARICDAVSHAHQRGLIHRDLKPANILVDDAGQPKILDFGVARLTDGDVRRTQHTDVGQLIGTLAYMSPEQVVADPLELDTRSDVYALGVILYELLAGRLPYKLSPRVHEAVRTIQEEEPSRLSSIRRTYRGDLETIAAKALEKDKTRRYGSAAALAADIRRHLRNEPIEARPASTAYHLQKFARRHRALVGGVAAVFVVMAAGIVATTREAIRARRAEEAAVAAEQGAQAVNDFLRNDLLLQAGASAQAGPGSRPDPDLKVRVALDRAASRIEGKFRDQPAVEASIRTTIGEAYVDLTLNAEAEQQLVRALDLRRRALGGEHPDTVASISNLAVLYSSSGKWGQAESLANQAVLSFRRILGRERRETTEAEAVLAEIYSYQGKFADAERLLIDIVAVQRRTLGERDEETLLSMNDLALNYRRQRKDAEAEQLYTRTLDLRVSVSGEEHPATLLVMNNLAGLYLAQGRNREAEALFVKLLERSRRALGDEHRNTLLGMSGLAAAYSNQWKLSDAESLNTSLLEVQRRVMGETHPATLAARNNLALVWWRQGRFADSEALNLEVLEQRRRDLGEDHPDTLASRQNLARVFRSQGRFDQAKTVLDGVLAGRQRVFGADNALTHSVTSDLGVLHRARGEYQASEALLTQALDSLKRVAAKDDAQTLSAMENLAELYRLESKHAEAATLLTALIDARRRTAGPESTLTATNLTTLGRVYLQQQNYTDAVSALRTATAIFHKSGTETWQSFHADGVLGAALSARGDFEEAERLLLSGYRGMSQRRMTMPAEDRTLLADARGSLVLLYTAWRKPDKAAEWKTARP